jgi:GT2 family glycosyltransferase
MQIKKIAAVLVTFNRKKLLCDAIRSLFNQTYPIDSIFIIDNASSDGTEEYLYKEKFILQKPAIRNNEIWKTFEKHVLSDHKLNLHYTRLPLNTGGAGGFSEGFSQVVNKTFDWVWVMDDDAQPAPDAIMQLSKYFDLKNISALTAAVIEPDGKIQLPQRGFLRKNWFFPLIQKPVPAEKYKADMLEIDLLSFVGSLINGIAIKKIDIPRSNFFIYNDDTEYCLRLRKLGKIYLIPRSVVYHMDTLFKNNYKKKMFNLVSYRIPDSSIWLFYYGQRNYIYIGKKICKSKIMFILQLFLSIFRHSAAIIMYDRYKLLRIRCLLKAYWNGIRGNFDNKYPKNLKIKMDRKLQKKTE